MAKTDRQTDKSSRWAFTAYEQQWSLFETISPGIAEWGWQEEICPDTNRKHYQGFIRTSQQQRFSWLKKLFPGVHLEVAKNWEALLQYCQKKQTAITGTSVHVTNTMYNKYSYNEYLFKKLSELYIRIGGFPNWTDDQAIQQIKDFAKLDIRAGHIEVSWIITDPGWITQCKHCWKDLLISYGAKPMVD